jgi:hypothetical protein
MTPVNITVHFTIRTRCLGDAPVVCWNQSFKRHVASFELKTSMRRRLLFKHVHHENISFHANIKFSIKFEMSHLQLISIR